MLPQLFQAFFLGLSMGPACLGYCAPVFFPLVASERQTKWVGTARLVGLFLLGRLAGYSLVGAGVGIAGALLLQGVSATAWGVVRIAMGILLILFGLLTAATRPRWCAMQGKPGRSLAFSALLGFLTGLNLCPPFGAAIAGAAAAGSVQSALFYFWSFFAGTALYFAPLVFISPLTRMEAFRQVARVCLFLSGVWLLAEGAVGIYAGK